LSELFVVGIGPGGREDMTLRADRVLSCCDIIVGYRLYVDLVRESYPQKEYIVSDMMREKERCKAALELAAAGKRVALICSGDSGVYGMASLVYELRGLSEKPEIEIVPGVTAALAGGALLGAPLGHDFAVISLSDRLTEWAAIEKRLVCAALSDMVIVLYNPASHARPDCLKRACGVLMRHIPEGRPCAVARNISRRGEKTELLTLGELSSAPADMFCTVFIGSSTTKIINNKLVTPRGYHDV